MSDVAVQVSHVHKKFRKGEMYDSLRDLIPAMTGRLFRQQELANDDKREFWALRDISFDVKRGEAFAIIGNNGAGKSTMFKILSRIMKPTKGKVVVNGRLAALIEISAGFHPDLTGRENVYLNGTILGMSRREIASKLDEIVAFSGLEEFIDTPVKRYSSGMYARLGFSVAAHVSADVLLVDEVLSVGDVLFQQKCMEHMRTLITGGATVLFVSHNMKAISELCDRAIWLNRGGVVDVGPTEAVVRSYLRGLQQPSADQPSRQVWITRVTVKGNQGEQATFETGQKAWVEVEIAASQRTEKLSIVLGLMDENFQPVFSTSTERLGADPFSIDAGAHYLCSFELTMNMANGTFYVSAAIHRYDIQKQYEFQQVAATIFVGSSLSSWGTVNCFPQIANLAPMQPSSVVEGKP